MLDQRNIKRLAAQADSTSAAWRPAATSQPTRPASAAGSGRDISHRSPIWNATRKSGSIRHGWSKEPARQLFAPWPTKPHKATDIPRHAARKSPPTPATDYHDDPQHAPRHAPGPESRLSGARRASLRRYGAAGREAAGRGGRAGMDRAAVAARNPAVRELRAAGRAAPQRRNGRIRHPFEGSAAAAAVPASSTAQRGRSSTSG